MSLLYRSVRWLSRHLFSLLYHHTVVNSCNIPSEGALIAPNHLSYLDPPLVACSLRDEAYFWARLSLFRNPIFGFLLRHLHALPVAGVGSDHHSYKALCHQLQKGSKVVIFPEGVRSSDGGLTRIKPGTARLALRTGAPIVPALIEGSYEIWPRSKLLPALRGRTKITFAEPLYPSKYAHLPLAEAQKCLTSDLESALQTLADKS